MSDKPLVAVIMGSQSDWATMEHSVTLLKALKLPYHAQVVSAHRTPVLLSTFAQNAESAGYRVIIAGAGGAAHLPGMVAANTLLPVIGVPIQSQALNGLDSLLSMVQMPAGVPVATVAIGAPGAKNAALLAASIIASDFDSVAQALRDYRKAQTESVLANLKLEEQNA